MKLFAESPYSEDFMNDNLGALDFRASLEKKMVEVLLSNWEKKAIENS